MSVNGAPAGQIRRERSFLHASMHPGFFEGFQSGGLRVSEPGLHSAFGEGPAPAPGPHQQKLDFFTAGAITHCGYLLALP